MGSNYSCAAVDWFPFLFSQWDADFVDVDQELLFELILAANYMDIKPLLDLTCAKVSPRLATSGASVVLRVVSMLTVCFCCLLREGCLYDQGKESGANPKVS